MSVALPPRYANIPSALLYSDLPAAVQRTAERIWGLGWQYNYERTGAVSLDEIEVICGLSRRQVFAHLRILVNRGVLRYSYSRTAGIYVFDLLPARPVCLEHSAEIRTVDTLSVVVVSDLSITASKQQQQDTSERGGSVRGGGAECGKPHCDAEEYDERVDVLEEMGVLEPTRSELVGLTWATREYLAAWWDWLEVQDGVGVGLVVSQIRAREIAPRLTRKEREKLRIREWAGEVVQR